MKAYLKNYRQAPRKVRLLAGHLIGKKVSHALDELAFTPQKAAEPLGKLIRSAVANARRENTQAVEENLVIKRFTVDKGLSFRRFKPRSRGRAAPINRESSHVRVELAEATAEVKKARKTKKASSLA